MNFQVNQDMTPEYQALLQESIRQGIRLHWNARKEYQRQCEFRDAGKSYDFTAKHAFMDGVRAIASILQLHYKGMVNDHLNALEQLGTATNWFEDRNLIPIYEHILCGGNYSCLEQKVATATI